MLRKIGLIMVTIAVGCFTLGTEAAHAYRPAVVAEAEIACDWSSGTMRFRPALVTGGTTPTEVTFKGELACRSNNPDVADLPYGITTGKARGSFSIPRNACNFTGVEESDGGPGTVKIRWKGNQKIVPTVLSPLTVDYRFGSESAFGYPDIGLNPRSPGTGSFTFGNDSADLMAAGVFDPAGGGHDVPESTCGPKIKGVKGSGKGIRKLPICICGVGFIN